MECSYWISAKVASRLVKGVVAKLNGRVSVQPYIGKDGTAKAWLNMHCNSIKVHRGNGSGKAQENETAKEGNATIENIAAITESMDDIPF